MRTMVSVVVVGGAAAFTCAATLGRTSATTNTVFACCSSSSSKGGGGFLGKCPLGKFPPSGRGQRTKTFGVSVSSVSSYSIRRTRGRRKRVTIIKNEIRTSDGNSKAARVLGLSLAEAKDERKLKRAYRRHALRTHPDTGGKSASAEAFQEVQKAYRTLRLEIASPDNEALTKEMSKDEE